MSANQDDYRITTMCRVLEVSRSGYYDCRGRPPSERTMDDAVMTDRIKKLHDESRQIYGSPRIYADLVELKIYVGRKRIARLMREVGIRGVCRRKKWRTTRRGAHPGAPDRVERDFTADGPDQLWVAESVTRTSLLRHGCGFGETRVAKRPELTARRLDL